MLKENNNLQQWYKAMISSYIAFVYTQQRKIALRIKVSKSKQFFKKNKSEQ